MILDWRVIGMEMRRWKMIEGLEIVWIERWDCAHLCEGRQV
jgi:hypothetical protein